MKKKMTNTDINISDEVCQKSTWKIDKRLGICFDIFLSIVILDFYNRKYLWLALPLIEERRPYCNIILNCYLALVSFLFLLFYIYLDFCVK